jgi:hypothetical protein
MFVKGHDPPNSAEIVKLIGDESLESSENVELSRKV